MKPEMTFLCKHLAWLPLIQGIHVGQTCVILFFIGDLVLHLHGMVLVLSIYNKIESQNTFIFRFPKAIRPLRHITEIRLKETTTL